MVIYSEFQIVSVAMRDAGGRGLGAGGAAAARVPDLLPLLLYYSRASS